MKRIVCYANLNHNNSSRNVTDEQIKKFFEVPFYHDEIALYGVYIDRCEENSSPFKREKWNEMLQSCRDNKIDIITVPACSMVTPYYAGLIELVRKLKQEYNVDFYFMRENHSTGLEDDTLFFQFMMMLKEQEKELERSGSDMRKTFFEVTGCEAECPSAVTVKLNDVLYQKAAKISKDYGMSVDHLVEAFLEFAVEPSNEKMFEQVMGF